jgi:alcohol dehydrogenase
LTNIKTAARWKSYCHCDARKVRAKRNQDLPRSKMRTIMTTLVAEAPVQEADVHLMKALVYRGPGKKALEHCQRPKVTAPTDAIVKITNTTICGTDLHILKGDVPTCKPGRILGHEGVGVVDSVGAGVTSFRPGDRVLISCITACGKCEYCRKGMFSHCTTGGWILGNEIDGTQAEYVRIPHADTSLYRLPEGVEEEALVMLSDILPTGFECGVLNGKVQPGDTVAIVGAGPIGLAALLTAQFYSRSPSALAPPRLLTAKIMMRLLRSCA